MIESVAPWALQAALSRVGVETLVVSIGALMCECQV